MALAWEVRSVADPDRQRLRPHCLAEADAVDVVRDRLRPDRRIGMGERAVLVAERLSGAVLKAVGVHRVEAEALGGGLVAQFGRVRHLVPRNVKRHAGGGAGQLLDHSAVSDLVEEVARLARAGEPSEAGTTGADAPRRERDAKVGDLFGDHLDVCARPRQHLAQMVVVRLQGQQDAGVPGLDQALVDPLAHGVTSPFRPSIALRVADRPCTVQPGSPFSVWKSADSAAVLSDGSVRASRLETGPGAG